MGHTVLFLWDLWHASLGLLSVFLGDFLGGCGKICAKWQHTICALSVCKRDVSRILHFVHAKLSSFPKSLLEETWKREPSKKNITIYQQRHHYHNLHHKHNHDNHHFIHIHLVSSHPPSLAPFALSHSENRAIGSVSVLKEYSVTCGCWRAISWGTAEKFSEQLCFFVVPAKTMTRWSSISHECRIWTMKILWGMSPIARCKFGTDSSGTSFYTWPLVNLYLTRRGRSWRCHTIITKEGSHFGCDFQVSSRSYPLIFFRTGGCP